MSSHSPSCFVLVPGNYGLANPLVIGHVEQFRLPDVRHEEAGGNHVVEGLQDHNESRLPGRPDDGAVEGQVLGKSSAPVAGLDGFGIEIVEQVPVSPTRSVISQ